MASSTSAAAFSSVTPAYRWGAEQWRGDPDACGECSEEAAIHDPDYQGAQPGHPFVPQVEHWVVEYPRGRRGRGICRIETQQMAETLAGMLNRALSLGAGTNQARWDELRGRVMEENEGADPIYGDLGWVLRAMDEIQSAPPGEPHDAMRARWAAENAPDPGPTDRQLTDWAEHDAHADALEPEAEC